MTEYSNGSFTTRDGNQLFEQAWLPEDPKAAIVIVHGVGEHSSRYSHVADHLNKAGYAVYSYDQLGHGQSEGERAYVDSFDIYRIDLLQFLNRVSLKQRDLPLFVLAHSMGGAVFAYTAVRDMPKVSGIIFSASAFRAGKGISPLTIKIARLLGRFAPHTGTSAVESNQISRDPKVVANYDNDPLNFHGKLPARTASEMLRAFDEIEQSTEYLSYPMLVLHGTGDKITDPEGSLQVYARASSTDKTMKLYDDLYHEILNEPEKGRVLDDITAWLDEQVAKAGEAQTQSHHQRRQSSK